MIKPFPFQREDADRITQLGGRALAAWEMGLGKTVLSLLWMTEAEAFPAIVVCPASIKWNWEREAKVQVNIPAQVLSGTKPDAGEGLVRPRLVILNYDILGAWLPYLRELKPKLIVADEVSYIKSLTTQRTKNLRKLCAGVPHVLALSGTPLVSRPAELFSVLNLLRPDEFPNWRPFAFRYCQPKRTHWGWDYRGATRLGELHERCTKTCLIRRRKEDVLKDLPAKTRVVVPLDIDQRASYRGAVKDFLGWMRTHHSTKLARAVKAEQLTKLSYLKRLSAQLKLSSVYAWVDDFLESSASKLILFGVHHAILDALHARYAKNSVLVTGRTSLPERRRCFEAFTRSASVRLFLGNVQAAGIGWNGIAAADVAFCELPWTPGECVQAEDRVHRIGQQRPCTVTYLVAKDTIEDYLCALIQKKFAVLSDVLDNGKTRQSFNLYDQLTRQLEKSHDR